MMGTIGWPETITLMVVSLSTWRSHDGHTCRPTPALRLCQPPGLGQGCVPGAQSLATELLHHCPAGQAAQVTGEAAEKVSVPVSSSQSPVDPSRLQVSTSSPPVFTNPVSHEYLAMTHQR